MSNNEFENTQPTGALIKWCHCFVFAKDTTLFYYRLNIYICTFAIAYLDKYSIGIKVSASDEIYKYDRQGQQSMLAAKPWEKDPYFFKVTY